MLTFCWEMCFFMLMLASLYFHRHEKTHGAIINHALNKKGGEKT